MTENGQYSVVTQVQLNSSKKVFISLKNRVHFVKAINSFQILIATHKLSVR